MSITDHRAYWAILFGCLVFLTSIVCLYEAANRPISVFTTLAPFDGMTWNHFRPDQLTPGSYEVKMLLDSFQAKAGTAQPPICTIEAEVCSANGASGGRLYLISMSQDQFTAFRQAVISHGADQIDPPENPDIVPLWWNPPKVTSLRWDNGRAYATYDSSKQLLYFRNYRLNSENYGRGP